MKKKVMFLIDILNIGGAETVLIHLLKNLDRKKYDITLILINDTGSLICQVPDDIRIRYLTHGNRFKKLSILCKLMRWIPLQMFYRLYIPEHYDIEIAFLEGAATHMVGSSGGFSKRIAWVHTDMVENRWADSYFASETQQRNLYRRFHQIVCVSDDCKRKFIQRFGEDYTIKTIYNVICEDEIRKKAKQPYRFEEKQHFTFITVGRLSAEKGVDRLLHIQKKLLDNGYRCEIWLVGDGPMRPKLKKYIEKNQMNGYVKLAGFRENPYPFFTAADCYVCPSYVEGYSTAVSEALILGTPVISTDCSGMRELLGEGKYGLLVDNSEEALYQAMCHLLENRVLYEELKQKAIMAGGHFSMKERIKVIEQMLDDL